MDFEGVELRTEDGETIAAWFVPAPGGLPRGTVLFCHGNAGNIGDRIGSIATFHNLKMDVLIFDYRGYGQSTGKPSEKGTYRDAMAAWSYLTEERGLRPGQIAVFGRSLGGGVASWLAARTQPGALVLESAFTSAGDMATKMFPLLPGKLVCRFRYDSLAQLKEIRAPVLIAHSRDDTMIPIKYGRRLFEAAREPKRFVEMAGDHNAGGLDVDPEYQRVFREFMDQHLDLE
jgi:fermentation-respiration switch protein FrsA (DUF1100 family)